MRAVAPTFKTTASSQEPSVLADSSCREQLNEIYDFSSQIFNINIDSPQSLFDTITALVKDLKALKKDNDKMQSNAILKNQDLMSSSSELSEKRNKQENEKSKLARFKRQMRTLQQTINDQQTNISDYTTQIQELQLNVQNLTSQNNKYEQEIIRLKKSIQDLKNSENVDNSNNTIETTVSLFEDVIQSQSEEIILLCEQRDELSLKLHLADQLMNRIESEYQALEAQKVATFSSLKGAQSKISEIESMIPQIIDEIHQLDLPYTLISKSDDLHDFIIETIANIVNRNKNLNLMNSLNSQNQSNQSSDAFVSKAQYELVLKHLEGSMKFIQNLANAGQPIDHTGNSLYVDNITRTLLLTQCARLGHFLDNNHFSIESPNENIFDPKILKSPEQLFAPILERASPEVMSQSPTREIYAFLIGVCEVNKLLLNYIEHTEHGNKEALNSGFDANEMEALKIWKSDQENKLQIIADEMGTSDVPLDDLLDHIMEVYLDTIQENKELQNELQKTKDQSFNKEQSDAENMKQQLDAVEDCVSREKGKHQKEVNNLKKEVMKYKAEIAKLKENCGKFSEVIKQKEHKYQKARMAQRELLKVMEEIETKVKQVSEENTQLNGNIEEMNEVLKRQNLELSKSADKIQTLHNQKSLLKNRIQELESKNDNILTEIKNRSEALDEKYSTAIKNLERDVKEAQDELLRSEEEKEKVTKLKNEISNQMIKMRVNERAMKIKLEALENRNAMNRRESENVKSALIQSVKAEVNIQIENAKSEYEKLKYAIIRILEDKFQMKIIGDSPTTEDIIYKIENCLKTTYNDQMRIKDLAEAREILGIPETQTMTKGAKSIAESIKQLSKQNAEFRSQSENVKRKTIEMDQKRNEQEMAIKIANEWETWSRSIFYQVTDGTAAVQGSKDIRFILEEALLSTIGHRGLLSKLEILRTEKKIFKNFGKLEQNNNTNLKGLKILSIRPIMVGLMCTRRLQVTAGRLPVKLVALMKRDDTESTASSYQ